MSAILEQEIGESISFHARCRRGGSCNYLLLYTVFLLSTDNIILIVFHCWSLKRYSSLTHSFLNLKFSCLYLSILMSLNHGLQILTTRPRSILIDVLFVQSQYLFGVDRTVVCEFCRIFPESWLWDLHGVTNDKPERCTDGRWTCDDKVPFAPRLEPRNAWM